MNILKKTVLTVAAVGLMAGSVAACSSSSNSSSSSSKPSAASTAPVADLKSLTGVSTSVKLDAKFVAALTSLGLTPGVLGTATLADGSVTFPITGGHVTVYNKGAVNPYVQGDIQHSGSGLSLAAGATTVQLQNFDINPGNSKLYGDVSVNGTLAVSHAYLFNLDGSTLAPLQTTTTTATLTGTTVEISPDAAALLNKTFNTTAVTAGLVVGIATIVVNLT